MEAIQDQEDSMNSSNSCEEVDQPEQDNINNDVGIRRSYECVFCKRGFTTAQALGGHMNIHRKDRAAKTRPPALISHKHHHQEIYGNPMIYQQISSYQPRYSYVPREEAQVDYRTYIPASTSAARPSYDFYDQNPHRFNPFGDDWRMSLSLQFGPVPEEERNRVVGSDDQEDDELDLELRLGGPQ
ncbi:zinc finger protein 11-like [Camellia sinensis]|uniref:C2H2-type domain-containing protein n=1 Tax=Camellia sinensis var. sinensis TaxID=542762 RepID=A0A4V3WNS2_CAMSN|nr:zinc finger protein 11-like [Camellia sinensis]THG13567.1 hypothetical protein TEA_007830 [Camellia sinensis var. sinensis]